MGPPISSAYKTCWYTTIHPQRVGAIVGSREVRLTWLRWSGSFHFGAAFQIRDDLLNLVGDEQTYGKGDPRRPLRGQAHAAAGGSDAAADGGDGHLVVDILRRSPAERSPENWSPPSAP